MKDSNCCFSGDRLKIYSFGLVFDWLRSPRNNSNNVAICNSNGTVNNTNYNNTDGYVRPDLPHKKNAMKAVKAVFQGTGYNVHALMWYDWLRSPRNNSNNVAICWSNGTVNNANYNDTNGYVRPDLPCFSLTIKTAEK